jgi:hypothetical protein
LLVTGAARASLLEAYFAFFRFDASFPPPQSIIIIIPQMMHAQMQAAIITIACQIAIPLPVPRIVRPSVPTKPICSFALSKTM